MSDRICIQFSTAAPSSFVPFTKGWPNRWSKAIRMFGHSRFSHVDFLLDSFEFEGKTYTDCLLGASNNPSAPIIYGNPCGVAVRPPDYQSFGIRRRMVLTTDRANAILDYAKAQVGKPFDAGAIHPKVFLADPLKAQPRDWREPSKWFCMELIIVSCEKGGLWGDGVLIPYDKDRITPADGYMIFMMAPYFMNRATFFDPLHTLKMGIYER